MQCAELVRTTTEGGAGVFAGERKRNGVYGMVRSNRPSGGSLVRRAVVAALLAALVAGCGGGGDTSSSGGGGSSGATTSAKPIRIAFSTWNGYIGIVIGVKEGLFEKAGVKVSYTVVEDPVQRFNALKSGSLDAIATTPDTFSRTYAKGIKSVQVLGLDASVGGDGIVAQKDVQTVADLKGQQVGVSAGSTSQWFLAYVLQQNGLSLDDVKQVDMTSGDAGSAFAAGKVPVAVTWEPWLSKAQKNPDGHVLVSSEKYPTIITDQVAFDPAFVKENPESVKAFVKGYQAAVDFLHSNEDKALEDVTDYLGQSPDEIRATMKTVPIWGIKESQQYYGTKSSPGPIFDIFKKSARFWKDIGEIDSLPDPSGAIDPSFVQQGAG
jgi:NitT/TauT family transport system substrate-binding protein